jgi:hypothetical protein
MTPDEPLAIEVSELREALMRLLDVISARFGPSVPLNADHYWTLSTADRFDLAQAPSVQAAQLSDDVESVRQLLSRDSGEIVLWHDVEHLTGILQRIASLDLT